MTNVRSLSVEAAVALAHHLNEIGGIDYAEDAEYFKIAVITEALRRGGISVQMAQGDWINHEAAPGSTNPTLFAAEVEGEVIGSYGDLGWLAINQAIMKRYALSDEEIPREFLPHEIVEINPDLYPPGCSLAQHMEHLIQIGAAFLQGHTLTRDTTDAKGATSRVMRL